MSNVISDIITRNQNGEKVWLFDDNNKIQFAKTVNEKGDMMQNLTVAFSKTSIEDLSPLEKINNCEKFDLTLYNNDLPMKYLKILFLFVERNPLKSLKLYINDADLDASIYQSLLKKDLEVFELCCEGTDFTGSFHLNLNVAKNMKVFTFNACAGQPGQTVITLPNQDHPIESISYSGTIVIKKKQNISSLKSVKEIDVFSAPMENLTDLASLFMDCGLEINSLRRCLYGGKYMIGMISPDYVSFEETVRKDLDLKKENCHCESDVFRYDESYKEKKAFIFIDNCFRTSLVVTKKIINDVYVTKNLSNILIAKESLLKSVLKYVKYIDGESIKAESISHVKKLEYDHRSFFTGYRIKLA